MNVSPFYAGNQPDGYRSIKCKKSFAHCGHFTKYVQHGHLWALHQDADDADVLWMCPHFTVRGPTRRLVSRKLQKILRYIVAILTKYVWLGNGEDNADADVVDRPTQLICISDIYLLTQIQKT